MDKKYSFFYRNSLSIVFGGMFFISLIFQALTGWKEHNQEWMEKGGEAYSFLSYLSTGHFIQATFENWESEFLQMGLYVWFTVFLRQKGSAESKPIEGEEDVDKEPEPNADAPWPVRKGGIVLSIYKYSLSLMFLILFLISFSLHFAGSLKDYNMNQKIQGKAEATVAEFAGETRFWFESFQNWQSEFLSIISIVVLSIFLRHMGSPESKPVDAPHMETGR